MSEQISYHSRTEEELRSIVARPALHPYNYIEESTLIELERDPKTHEAIEFFRNEQRFRELRRFNAALLIAVLNEAGVILQERGEVEKEKWQKLSSKERIDYLKQDSEEDQLTKADRNDLNAAFYRVVEEYLSLSLPKKVFFTKDDSETCMEQTNNKWIDLYVSEELLTELISGIEGILNDILPRQLRKQEDVQEMNLHERLARLVELKMIGYFSEEAEHFWAQWLYEFYIREREEIKMRDENAKLSSRLPLKIQMICEKLNLHLQTKIDIDSDECKKLYLFWQQEADRLVEEFCQELIGTSQPLTLREEFKANEPYESVLGIQNKGEVGFTIGRKLALIEGYAEISQLCSPRGGVDLLGALDYQLRRPLNKLIKLLNREVFVEGGRVEKVIITSYLDPKHYYRPAVITYRNAAGEPETVFALGAYEFKVNESLEELLRLCKFKSETSEEKGDIVILDSLPTNDTFKQALGNFFESEKITDEDTEEHDFVLRELADILTEIQAKYLIKSEKELNCRIIEDEILKKHRYVVLYTGEKVRTAILIKGIRRGYDYFGRVRDRERIGTTFLNLEDARFSAPKIERALPFEFGDLDDTLIEEVPGEEKDAQSAEGFRARTFITRCVIKENGQIEPVRRRDQFRDGTLIEIEVQERTFLTTEHGIDKAAHWRYRLRQYFANFLRLLFPPEFFGERFNVTHHLDNIQRFYQAELNNPHEMQTRYQSCKERYEAQYNETYDKNFHDYISSGLFLHDLILNKLYDYPEILEEESLGLLTLSKEEIEQHPLKEDIQVIKRITQTISQRGRKELAKILGEVDEFSKEWVIHSHDLEIDEAIREATVEFLLDFLRPISQEDGGS